MEIKLDYKNTSNKIVINSYNNKVCNDFKSCIHQMNPCINSPDELKNGVFANAPYNVRKSWMNVFNSLPKEDKLYAAIILLELNQIKSGQIKSNNININNYSDDINGYVDLFNTLSEGIQERLQNNKYTDLRIQIAYKKEYYIINKFMKELRKYM
ncbi:hypothetical protein CLRAG_17290 [Clostridium ragsdalei P11]|uniref:Uncharacterized protein n=1 Tax=Clostridium ragsdalei P11 TaxID=1353534 RepID=A0A1A6AVC3_9CLOT|nr:hypothetical protein [Clostridium ragsdalei]OBR94036.1 hypothetical protein CLRAG_17290 [Clostridium ragsdalei P11]